MPDTYKISEFTTASQVKDEDYVELSQADSNVSGGRISLKTTILAIANKIATAINFSGLSTTSKNLVGAINEAASAGGSDVEVTNTLTPSDTRQRIATVTVDEDDTDIYADDTEKVVKDMCSDKTYTGNPVTVESVNGGKAKSCEVSFGPVQAGTGDPSPTNIRPISGWDELTLNVSDGETETEGTDYSATFEETIMGGSYDFVSGIGSSEWRKLTINAYGSNFNDLDRLVRTNTVRVELRLGSYAIETHSYSEGADYIECDILPTTGSSAWATGNDFINISSLIGYNTVLVMSLPISIYGSTPEEINTALGTNPIEICYKLATPTEIALTAEQIELLKGQNVLWSDANGNIAITAQALEFLPDTGTDIPLKTATAIVRPKPGETNGDHIQISTDGGTTFEEYYYNDMNGQSNAKNLPPFFKIWYASPYWYIQARTYTELDGVYYFPQETVMVQEYDSMYQFEISGIVFGN